MVKPLVVKPINMDSYDENVAMDVTEEDQTGTKMMAVAMITVIAIICYIGFDIIFNVATM